MPVKVLVDAPSRLRVLWVERPVAVLLGKVAANKANGEGVARNEEAERGSGTRKQSEVWACVVERSDLGLWKQQARVAVRTMYTYTMIAWDSASLKDPPSSEIAGTVPSGEA